MAVSDVLKFMQETAVNEPLRSQLAALLGVGDGNISDQAALDQSEAAALQGDLAPAVVAFAASKGFNFSVKELSTAVDAFAQYQAGILSEQGFANVLGISTQEEQSIKSAVEIIYRGMRYQKIDGQLVRQGLPVVMKFMQKTAIDKGLQNQLATILGVGDGNISDQAALDQTEAAALKGDLAPAVVEFAAKRGYKFSVKELGTAIDTFARFQAGDISEQDFVTQLGISAQEESSIKSPIELIYRGMHYQRIDGQLVRQGLPVVMKFMQKTAVDKEFQQQLAALLGVGDGNISDQAALDQSEAAALGNLAPAVVAFASSKGFSFSAEELTSMLDIFAQYQSGQLSAQQFASLVGLSAQEQASVQKTIELVYRGTRYQKS
uniref:Uncharacterized protein n=1 Tax=Cyanothece sp. (strain PCC 7425 / ATCC 29141) TaxID=395961 RepID=B8HKE9_CYAP4